MRPPATSQNRPVSTASVKKSSPLHWLVTALAAVSLVIAMVFLFTSGANLPDSPNWPEALLLSLVTACTVTALARQLPWQNVFMVVGVIAVVGGVIHALGVKTSIPFGPFVFEENAGPKMFNTLPWEMPLLWVVVILNARGVGRLILRPWRKTKNYGLWLIGLAAVLAMLFDFALDPFVSHIKHYWLWTPTKFPLTWHGATVVSFLVWGFVSALMLAFATPALIKKQPGQRSTPDFHPLGIWLGALLLFATASALTGLWTAVAADAAIGIVTAVFAIRGGRW
jgi:uncharacterized membrane protein